jgi:hypothetical protein
VTGKRNIAAVYYLTRRTYHPQLDINQPVVKIANRIGRRLACTNAGRKTRNRRRCSSRLHPIRSIRFQLGVPQYISDVDQRHSEPAA